MTATLTVTDRVKPFARVRVSKSLAAVVLAACILAGAGCGDPRSRNWGEAVDPEAAVPLAELLSGDREGVDELVTVSGRIGEVCRSAGCWFVLQNTGNGKLYELLVDLKPRATFTVPTGVQGREAVVRGRLVGEKPDLRLQAVGLTVE